MGTTGKIATGVALGMALGGTMNAQDANPQKLSDMFQKRLTTRYDLNFDDNNLSQKFVSADGKATIRHLKDGTTEKYSLVQVNEKAGSAMVVENKDGLTVITKDLTMNLKDDKITATNKEGESEAAYLNKKGKPGYGSGEVVFGGIPAAYEFIKAAQVAHDKKCATADIEVINLANVDEKTNTTAFQQARDSIIDAKVAQVLADKSR